MTIARYYFDKFDGQRWILDQEGLDCEDLNAVRKAAHAALTDPDQGSDP